MDVDSLTNKSKNTNGDSKGKGEGGGGKNGKGKDSYGSKSGKGKGGSSTKFDGYCHNCQKYGHRASDCWSKVNSERPKGKSKGKSGKSPGKSKGANSLEQQEPEHEGETIQGLYLDVSSVSHSAESKPNPKTWQKYNLDTGAAISAYPKN